jgi:hypothetical protein
VAREGKAEHGKLGSKWKRERERRIENGDPRKEKRGNGIREGGKWERENENVTGEKEKGWGKEER